MIGPHILADYIEKGLAIAAQNPESIKESDTCYIRDINGVCLACAMGLAFIGKCGNLKKAQQEYQIGRLVYRGLRTLAILLECDIELADLVESAHCKDINAETIVKKLRNGTLIQEY